MRAEKDHNHRTRTWRRVLRGPGNGYRYFSEHIQQIRGPCRAWVQGCDMSGSNPAVEVMFGPLFGVRTDPKRWHSAEKAVSDVWHLESDLHVLDRIAER
jgi:hypothetical protein